MELVVLFDHRFYRAPGQPVYSPTSYSYSFFQKRYLCVFDTVTILARVDNVPLDSARSHQPTEGPCVRLVDIGGWTRARGLVNVRRAAIREMEQSMNRRGAFLIIAPGVIPSLTFGYLVRRNYPFAAEVVGDPWEAFSPGACRHPLRPILRECFSRALRRQCRLADAALYVTKSTLQMRYPCGGLTAGVSDVVLPPEAFVGAPKTFHARTLTIVTVAGMAQLYKGQDLLMTPSAPAFNGDSTSGSSSSGTEGTAGNWRAEWRRRPSAPACDSLGR